MARFALPMDGARVDRLMMAAGVTPGQLAKDAGVSGSTVSRARGGRPVTIVSGQRIAAALSRYERNPALVALLPEVHP
jgi:hypothetical protein